jgi:hypothetical protein
MQVDRPLSTRRALVMHFFDSPQSAAASARRRTRGPHSLPVRFDPCQPRSDQSFLRSHMQSKCRRLLCDLNWIRFKRRTERHRHRPSDANSATRPLRARWTLTGRDALTDNRLPPSMAICGFDQALSEFLLVEILLRT